MGAGADTFYEAKFQNGDSVDMGAGDDIVYIAIDTASVSMSKLDGGAGTDTLYFGPNMQNL